jgi:hypothetical protein
MAHPKMGELDYIDDAKLAVGAELHHQQKLARLQTRCQLQSNFHQYQWLDQAHQQSVQQFVGHVPMAMQ